MLLSGRSKTVGLLEGGEEVVGGGRGVAGVAAAAGEAEARDKYTRPV